MGWVRCGAAYMVSASFKSEMKDGKQSKDSPTVIMEWGGRCGWRIKKEKKSKVKKRWVGW